MEELFNLQTKLESANKNEVKLETQLAKANNKFMRLENLLHSTEAELSAVKEDLVNLRDSKTDTARSDYNMVDTNKMVKKILNKLFKRMKNALSEDNGADKSFSCSEVEEFIGQQFRDVATFLEPSMEHTKIDSTAYTIRK